MEYIGHRLVIVMHVGYIGPRLVTVMQIGQGLVTEGKKDMLVIAWS